MKLIFATLLFVLTFSSIPTLAQPNMTLAIGGAGNCELIINGQGVGGCISSFTRLYQFGNGTYVFGVGARDGFPYYYSLNTRTWSLITNTTQLRSINDAYVGADNSVTLNVTGSGGSSYPLAANIYYAGHGNMTVAISNCQLIFDGINVGGCVSFATRPYEFAGTAYIFAIDARSGFPCYYNINQHHWNLIAHNTQLRSINHVFVAENGMITLQVTGSGGSNYDVNANIFIGNRYPQPQPPRPQPEPARQCFVERMVNRSGHVSFLVKTRHGAVIADVFSEQEAVRISRTDPRCHE